MVTIFLRYIFNSKVICLYHFIQAVRFMIFVLKWDFNVDIRCYVLYKSRKWESIACFSSLLKKRKECSKVVRSYISTVTCSRYYAQNKSHSFPYKNSHHRSKMWNSIEWIYSINYPVSINIIQSMIAYKPIRAKTPRLFQIIYSIRLAISLYRLLIK